MANHSPERADGMRFAILNELKILINETYSGEIWQAVKVGLATACALSLRGRTNPLAVIFEGPSGRGKSTIINMFAPDRPSTTKFLYRLDGFTSKSFVSHAASKTTTELTEIDLLPKIKDKLLITKELAPLFRGREDALRENFATITAVLDGKGHLSASGVHGTRGYEGEHVFNWIGGTTPIPADTDRIMAQLGNRLLRYEIIGQAPTEDELLEFAASYTASDVDKRCKALVNAFLEAHFGALPLNSVELGEVQMTEEQRRFFVRAAKLTAQGRVEAQKLEMTSDNGQKSYDYVAGEPEGPQRIILLIRTFLAGLALLEEQPVVTSEGLEFALHLAFSSIPMRRRRTLRALLTSNGEINTSTLMKALTISAPTARDMMKELAATGLARFTRRSNTEADTIVLAAAWHWLLPLSAENEMRVCEEELVEA